MKPRVFIDANVPMYAAGSEHPLKSPCVKMLAAAAEGQIYAVTDAEVLQEIMHRYASLGRREQGGEVAELFMRVVLDVLPVTREDMVQALALYRQYPEVQTRDVVHNAVMHSHEVRVIATADRHFEQFAGLRRVDPVDFGQYLAESL